MSYAGEASVLDGELLDVITAWRDGSAGLSEAAFSDIALRIFDHQRSYNRPYGRYSAALGYPYDRRPPDWRAIPALPTQAYKEAAIATFDPRSAAAAFRTSGTTTAAGGMHYLEHTRLYDAALLATFERSMLPDGARLRYLNLVPDPRERPHSSLGYMMARVAERLGDDRTGWFAGAERLAFEAFERATRDAIAAGAAVCVAATAFALSDVLDAMDESGVRLVLPPGSRVMETGGFKGRARVVSREDLYARVASVFGIGEETIVAEYGMTELTSQYYDDVRFRKLVSRRKTGPPWLRSYAVDAAGAVLSDGIVGALVHVDLANRSSCLAVATEDLGAVFADGSLILVGREAGAALRGCSLDAEELRGARL